MAAVPRLQTPLMAASDRVHLLIGFHVTDDPCSHVGSKSGDGMAWLQGGQGGLGGRAAGAQGRRFGTTTVAFMSALNKFVRAEHGLLLKGGSPFRGVRHQKSVGLPPRQLGTRLTCFCTLSIPFLPRSVLDQHSLLETQNASIAVMC